MDLNRSHPKHGCNHPYGTEHLTIMFEGRMVLGVINQMLQVAKQYKRQTIYSDQIGYADQSTMK